MLRRRAAAAQRARVAVCDASRKRPISERLCCADGHADTATARLLAVGWGREPRARGSAALLARRARSRSTAAASASAISRVRLASRGRRRQPSALGAARSIRCERRRSRGRRGPSSRPSTAAIGGDGPRAMLWTQRARTARARHARRARPSLDAQRRGARARPDATAGRSRQPIAVRADGSAQLARRRAVLGLGELALGRAPVAATSARASLIAGAQAQAELVDRRAGSATGRCSTARSSASTRSCCSAYSRCLTRRSSCSRSVVGRALGLEQLGDARGLRFGLAQALLAGSRRWRSSVCTVASAASARRSQAPARRSRRARRARRSASRSPSRRAWRALVGAPGCSSAITSRSVRRLGRTSTEASDEARDGRHRERGADVCQRYSLRSRQAMRDCSDHSSMKPGEAVCEKSPPDSANDASAAS